MSSWLDNIAAQHGEEESDGEDPPVAPAAVQPQTPAPQIVVVDASAPAEATAETPDPAAAYDEDTKSEISVDHPHRPAFKGNPSGTMRDFAKGVDAARKSEETAYVQVLLKIRRALTTVLAGTSKQMQAVGDSVKQSNDAKAKYQKLKSVIMAMNPPCELVDAPDTQEVIYYD